MAPRGRFTVRPAGMARGRRDGILIAGGGVAGSLAALAMARHRPEVPVMIVEARETFGGDAYRLFGMAELDAEAAALLAPVAIDRWPGYYTAFPGTSRKIRGEQSGFSGADIHRAMTKALKPRSYRLGARVVAVREDALVLDGGETIKAEGAIDARGAAHMTGLDLLYIGRFARDYRLAAPHRVDRPVLIDATVDQEGGLRFYQCIPLSDVRLIVAELTLSDRAQIDEQAGTRLDAYLGARGWRADGPAAESAQVRPIPYGGDFAAFWRLGGARVAKLGLRGGFVHPLTGRTVADAARNALLLAGQRDFAGGALHDLFEEEARRLWKRREPLRAAAAAIAATPPAERRERLAGLFRLDADVLQRIEAGALGLLDRGRLNRALRG